MPICRLYSICGVGLDYKTKTLKTQSTSVMDVPNMEMYHEDMNVDSGDYRWENYYNK